MPLHRANHRIWSQLVALAQGAAAGALLGLVARVPMRLVAIARLNETDFTVGGTLFIALVFAGAATGASVAGVLRLPGWGVLLVVLVTSAPLAVSGTGIGADEVGGAFADDLALGRLVVVVALTAVIASLAVAAPWVGYRVGRSRARVPPSQSMTLRA